MKPCFIALLAAAALFAAPAQAQSLQKGHTTELLHETLEQPIGVAVGTQLNNVIHDIGLTVDQPGRMSAVFPTNDSRLFIRSPLTSSADGSGRAISPTSNLVPLTVTSDTYIDFQSGSISGGNSVYTDGGTFTLPTITFGHFVRMVAVYQKDGSINTHFSSQVTGVGSLTNPGTLLASLSGDPIGWLDLQETTAGSGNAYKSAGAATNIISNVTSSVTRVYSFGSGGGGGGSGGSSSILWHPVDGNAPVYAEEYGEMTYQFPAGGGQQLRGTLQIPSSYAPGNPVHVLLTEYSPDTSGTNLLTCTSYLIQKSAATAVSSTTNSNTSSNGAINLSTLGIPYGYYQVSCDVTTNSGLINSVSVNPGDLLTIYVTRGSDSATSDIRVVPSGTGVIFQ